MKPLKWLLLLFAMVDGLLSSCTSRTPVVSQTGVIMTPETRVATAILTPSPEFSCPTTLPTSVNGTSQVLLIDEAPQDCFPTDAAKITAVTIESYILKVQVVYQGAARSIPLGYMPRLLFCCQTRRNGHYIYRMMRMGTRVPRMWRNNCRSICLQWTRIALSAMLIRCYFV